MTKCYQKMFEINKPGNIIIMGDSVGAHLALVNECFFDQANVFAGRLKSTGVKLNYLVGKGMFHVFPLFFFWKSGTRTS